MPALVKSSDGSLSGTIDALATTLWSRAAKKSRKLCRTSLPLGIFFNFENLAHHFRWVAASREITKNARAGGRGRRRLSCDPPPQGLAGELGITPVRENRPDRRLDDATGHSPASQFVHHPYTPAAPAQQQLLGAAPCQCNIVNIPEITKPLKRGGDHGRREAASTEVRRDLGRGSRSASKEAAGLGHHRRLGCGAGRPGLRSD
jgi:hypothetical protein